MHKIVIHKPGSYDRLRLEEHPDPVPQAGHVLVDVAAIGVNYADCVVRMGLYASAKRYVGWPITPGFEVCGRVSALGQGVDDLEIGARVIALTRFGGYATKLSVPRHQLFACPEALSDEQAAGLSVVFLTAYFAMHELAHPHAGDLILVHSAAGGVGGALVQLGRRLGCEVTGVVGAAHKVATAQALGATHVIDTTGQDLWASARAAAPGGFAAIFDANGVSTLKSSYDHLSSPGKLVVYGFHSMLPRRGGKPSWPRLLWGWLRTPRFNPLQLTGQNRSVLAFNLSYLFHVEKALTGGMQELLGWLEQASIRPPEVTSYPFEQAAKAQRDLESGTTTGKLVLVVQKR